MRWNEAVTLEFVKLYAKHECLWNPEHSGYRMRNEKAKAYSEFIAEFNAATSISLRIPEVKIKIKNLRSTYAQEVVKIMQRSTADAVYESTLVWFHEMDRCLKRVSVNRPSTTDDVYKQETSEVDSSCPVWVDMDNQPSEDHPDPLTPQEEENYSSQEEIHNIKQEWSPIPASHKKNKKRKYKLKNTSYVEETSNSSEIREDEFDIYGKYIATQLRNMELHKALKVQLKIQSLISRARMSDMDSFE